MPSRSFQDLVVWQRAHEFVLEIYRFTADFPKSETETPKPDMQIIRERLKVAARIGEELGYEK